MTSFFYGLLMCLAVACTSSRPMGEITFERLWAQVSMSGEGKARLEVPPESWVFSFESLREENDWQMYIQIPLQGEESFIFPGLHVEKPEIEPRRDDFRWQIIQALEDKAKSRKLDGAEVGQDFVFSLHHLLRWSYGKDLALKDQCSATALHQWECLRDGTKSHWEWDDKKNEFRGHLALRGNWSMRTIFKSLETQHFKRVTLEIVRQSEDKSIVELRQEFFFH